MTGPSSTCSACRSPLPAGHRFCTACGAAAAPAVAPVAPARRSSKALWIGIGVGAILAVLIMLLLGGSAPAAEAEVVVKDAVVTNAVDFETLDVLGATIRFDTMEPTLYGIVTVDAPANSTLQVSWHRGDEVLGESEMVFDGGADERQGTFIQRGDTAWKPGEYRLEFRSGETLVHVVPFEVASGVGVWQWTSAEWDVTYTEQHGFWRYRVLVTNLGPEPLTDLTMAAWINYSDESTGYAQRHQGLSVPARSQSVFLFDVPHPSNLAGRNVVATLVLNGGEGLAPLQESRPVFYNEYGGGGTQGGGEITIPETAVEQELDLHGAFAKWRVEFEESRDAWLFEVEVYNFEDFTMPVRVAVGITDPSGTSTDAEAVNVESYHMSMFQLRVPNTSPAGHSVEASFYLEAPEPLGEMYQTRSVVYNAYGGGTYGGDGF